MTRRRIAQVLAGVIVLVAALTSLAGAAMRPPPGGATTVRHLRPHAPREQCGGNTRVLMLGSYPAEISANLSAAQLDPGQPTVVDGHDFYLGTLKGRPVILGLSEQSPADAQATTDDTLNHFDCVSAVVMEGTAGGGAGENLGDVSVASEWEYQGQTQATPVDAPAYALAQSQVSTVDSQLLSSDTVADGSCGCDSSSSQTVSVSPRPMDRVGGLGYTDDTGTSDTCSAGGGELEGCNPCPPCPVAAEAQLRRLLRRDPTALGSRRRRGHATSTPAYVADDQQTTAVQAAADAHSIPFIAFRGVSDTLNQGQAYPLEFAVYQHLAADNAAIAAADWVAAWRIPASAPRT